VLTSSVQAASEWLRKKGLANADKKSGRLAAEGGVLAYIHPGSRLGVLLEVNCETDFVAAGEVFNKLANTLAMQIAASTVEYVAPEEIPADVFEKEKEIEMGREDLQSKPEAIRAKIAEGRVKKLVQVRGTLYDAPLYMACSRLFAMLAAGHGSRLAWTVLGRSWCPWVCTKPFC
jgi:elongation factor Ts